MAKRDIDYLKGKFSDGRVPTGSDFIDLIDSTNINSLSAELVSLIGNSTITGNLSVVNTLSAEGGFITGGLSGLTASLKIAYTEPESDPATLAVDKHWLLKWTNGVLTHSDVAPTPSVTPTNTVTPTLTPTQTPTLTPTPSVTPTQTPTNV